MRIRLWTELGGGVLNKIVLPKCVQWWFVQRWVLQPSLWRRWRMFLRTLLWPALVVWADFVVLNRFGCTRVEDLFGSRWWKVLAIKERWVAQRGRWKYWKAGSTTTCGPWGIRFPQDCRWNHRRHPTSWLQSADGQQGGGGSAACVRLRTPLWKDVFAILQEINLSKPPLPPTPNTKWKMENEKRKKERKRTDPDQPLSCDCCLLARQSTGRAGREEFLDDVQTVLTQSICEGETLNSMN